ncbi:MAG: hypothetical protein JXR76_18895 [Deltaproteobacteria bacterium]|nr:hypothetical protein [Deltaproteobacteria bacterium]
MNGIKWLWCVWTILVFCGGCTACTSKGKNESVTDTDTTVSAPVELHLSLDNATLPKSYVVTAVSKDGRTLRAACGDTRGQTSEGITCESYGIKLDAVKGAIQLTAKAKGYRFGSETIQVASLPANGHSRVHHATLAALAPFEVAEHYRTGFASDEIDAFLNMAFRTKSETGAVDAVKFIVMNPHTTPTVYFMDTKNFAIHYFFARDVLHLPLSSTEFTKKVYADGDREIMAGAIMYHANVEAESERFGGAITSPFELSFFPSDDLSVTEARLVHRLIEERLGVASLTGNTRRLYYMPAGEKKETELETDAELFQQWDAEWVLRREIYRQKSWQIMNTGVAYGTLRLADLAELEAEAFSFKDIVLLPGLPIQLPIVGGTITEEFQTPLSHVNVMAKNRGTPNLTLAEASAKPEIQALLGRLVRFEVTDESYTLKETTLEEAEAFWTSQSKDPITLKSDTSYNALPLFSEIGFKDWITVGAKAANLAELHQIPGAGGPRGFAIPFHYYQRFMAGNTVDTDTCANAQTDCVSDNRDAATCAEAHTLCTAHAGETLATYVRKLLETNTFSQDTKIREATLSGLRYLMVQGTTDADFAEALNAKVANVFGDSKVRLRSSTNTEDIPGFSGAGLYDSKSAYAQGEERASEVIRKVWASVWNWRAFEERSFWHIDHLSTQMGVAVNQSFGEEAVNGVLITQNIENPTLEGMYVNVQLGEISVTNPEGMTTPEIFTIIRGTEVGSIQPAVIAYSSLSPGKPIMTDPEIRALFDAATIVQKHFAPLYEINEYNLALDMEFKLRAGDRALVIKQARPYTH